MKILKDLIREYAVSGPYNLREDFIPKGEGKNPPWVLLGSVGGVPSFVIGPGAKAFLAAENFRPDQIDIIFNKFQNVPIERYTKYDAAFKNAEAEYGIDRNILKAMALEESQLGKILVHPNWPDSTASGVIHMTAAAVMELNKRRKEAGKELIVHADLQKPHYADSSIMNAAEFIRDVLKPRHGDAPSSWIPQYKTGPDAQNYLTRISALKKFILKFDEHARGKVF